MLVRVYFVGLMRSAASVFRGPSGGVDTSEPSLDSNSETREDGESDDDGEDRDTWPEAGLADTGTRTLAEMRIELTGSATDIDARTHRLLDVLERDVREITQEWDCRVDVTSGARGR